MRKARREHDRRYPEQALGVVVGAVWSAVATAASALAISRVLPMRVSEDDERQGLDIASHGERGWEFD
jgi:Amt family ammonium transporter